MYNLLCTAAAVSNLNPNPNTASAAALDYKCVKLLPAIWEEQQQLDRFLRDSFGEENGLADIAYSPFHLNLGRFEFFEEGGRCEMFFSYFFSQLLDFFETELY